MNRLLATTLLALVGILAFQPEIWAGQNVVVVLDDSGSMTGRMGSNSRVSKMDAAKEALRTVLSKLPSDAEVGIIILNGEDQPWVLPLGPINAEQYNQALDRIIAEGGTPLGQFMAQGANALLERRAQEHYGTYRLLIVTDGEANDPQLIAQFLPEILARGITTDVIGVDMDSDHSLATRVHTYRRADDPDSLEKAIASVFAETDDSAGDASESDFELLAAVPDELASAMLGALAETGNHPIGETISETNAFGSNSPGRPNSGGNVSADPEGDGGGAFASLLVFAVFMVFVVFVGLNLVKRNR